jgi:hypothetical protein
MPKLINESVDGDVVVKNDYTIIVGGKYYDIVCLSEPMYPDHDYIEWDGSYWVKQ